MARAERIHHAQRIKRKVSRYWNAQPGSERRIGMVSRTRKTCSCWMCGTKGFYMQEGDKAKYKALSQRRLLEGWDG